MEHLARFVEHGAPRRSRRSYADAEKAQGCLGQDHRRHVDRRDDEHGRDGVGQDVPNQNPQITCAKNSRGQDELAFAQRERLGMDDPRVLHPADHAEDRGNRYQAGFHHRQHAYRQHNRRKRQLQVDQAHDQ